MEQETYSCGTTSANRKNWPVEFCSLSCFGCHLELGLCFCEPDGWLVCPERRQAHGDCVHRCTESLGVFLCHAVKCTRVVRRSSPILCGDILKDCSKGEPSTTPHIAVYITVLSDVVNTQAIQPVVVNSSASRSHEHCSDDSAALRLYRLFCS